MTTKRFDKAVTQLYTAFNEGTLNAYDCTACAVGNMVGAKNDEDWAMHTSDGTFLGVGTDKEVFYHPPKHKDYTEKELQNIEYIFLKAFDFGHIKGTDKQAQYKGLMAVIEYLAQLDNIKIPDTTIEQFKQVLI